MARPVSYEKSGHDDMKTTMKIYTQKDETGRFPKSAKDFRKYHQNRDFVKNCY